MAKILSEITGFPALGIEGTLKCVHFYDNQYDAVNELMDRSPDTHQNCSVELSEGFKGLCALYRSGDICINQLFEEMDINMFKLVGYTSDEEISVEMLAPKEL